MTAMMTASICPYRAGGERAKQHKRDAHQFRLFHINLQLVIMAMFNCREELIQTKNYSLRPLLI
jgi:hypothetical protein